MTKYFAHPSSVIDGPCEIGAGTKIWHFCHVMTDARIGDSCILGQNVFVGRGVVIGNGVKIQNNVSVYEGVELEDNVFVGPSVVFTNVRNPRAHIERKHEFQKTLVRHDATIGANATIMCGTTLGCFSLVGAGAVVVQDVPDFALVIGVPARTIGWVCECAARLPLPAELMLAARLACPVCERIYVAGNGLLQRS
jgi:UDP-2-acetamido-3-amino-2,3-dideoxy-glucuronate N-acetyltransferase